MSIHNDFIDKIINHPEWEVIRGELCVEPDEPFMFDLGGGTSMVIGGNELTEEQQANENLWGELCWTVNSGPGYCDIAPKEIKVLLRRLGYEC